MWKSDRADGHRSSGVNPAAGAWLKAAVRGSTRPMSSLQLPWCARLNCPSVSEMEEIGILPSRHARMNASY